MTARDEGRDVVGAGREKGGRERRGEAQAHEKESDREMELALQSPITNKTCLCAAPSYHVSCRLCSCEWRSWIGASQHNQGA